MTNLSLTSRGSSLHLLYSFGLERNSVSAIVPRNNSFTSVAGTRLAEPESFPMTLVGCLLSTTTTPVTSPTLFILQVLATSPLVSPPFESYRFRKEIVGLVLWIAGLDRLTQMNCMASVPSGGIITALVRILAALCRVCDSLYTFVAMVLELSSLWLHLELRAFIARTLPVNLVLGDNHSPVFSVTESCIFPITPLVFSGFVIGSIMLKRVLLAAEVWMVLISRSVCNEADTVTSTMLEALLPLFGEGNQVYQDEDFFFIRCIGAFATMVELLGSPLSPRLYWSSYLRLVFSICLTTLLVDVLVLLALYTLMYSTHLMELKLCY